MRRSIAFGIVTALAGASACSIIVGDLSYLRGSDATDASTPIADGASDANANAFDATLLDAAGSSFCATVSPTPQFCADFDEDAGLSAFQIQGSTHGAILLEADAYSPPFALQSAVSQAVKAVAISDAGTPGANMISFSARMRIDQMPTHANIELFHLNDATQGYHFFAVVQGGQMQLWFASTSQGGLGGNTPIPLATWKQLDVTVNLSTNPVAVTAKLDGAVFCADTVPAFVPTGSQVYLGFSYESDNSPVAVSFDNVVLATQ